MCVLKVYVFVTRLSVLAVACMLAACAGNVASPSTSAAGGASNSSSVATTALTGIWKPQSVTTPDGATVAIDKPELFTLEFSDATRLAARIDCNRGAGSFALDGDMMTIGAMAVTKAYCAETARVGDLFITALFGEHVVSATATSLVLSSSRATLRFGRF
jgi:heat shock protein HslJ